MNVRARLHMLIYVGLYFLAVILNVKLIIVESYSYVGYSNNEISTLSWMLLLLEVIISGFLLPLKTIRPSQYILYLFYFLIFIPGIVISFNVSKEYILEYDAQLISLMMFSSLLILFIPQYFPLYRIAIKPVIPKNSHIVTIMTILTIVYVMSVFYSNFSFIKLGDVYSKREQAGELTNKITDYLVPWLTSFMLPIMFSRKYQNRKYFSCFFIVLVYFLLFFMLGAKMYLVAVGYFLLAIIFCKYNKNGTKRISLLLSLALVFPFILGLMSASYSEIYIGLVNFRAFSIQGLAPAIYYHFFSNNEFTLFSHIKGLNFFIEYPYKSQLSIVFNEEYGIGNFNTNFLFGDGFAGGGFLGMLFVSAIASFFFYFIDCISSEHDHNFVIISLAIFAPSILNVPLMTSMITGGGLLFVMYYLFSRSMKRS